MSHSSKLANFMGAGAIVVSGLVLAAPPFAFDGWAVAVGDITAPCDTDFTCGDAVVGDGFFQRQVVDNITGDTYFQTIITDTGVTATDPGTLDFSDESFVLQGNTTGLANRSRSSETTTVGTVTEVFSALTELQMGWAAENGLAANNLVQVKQSINSDDSTTTDYVEFDTGFWLDQLGDLGASGKHLRLATQIGLAQEGAFVAVQDFVLVDKSGPAFVLAGGGVDVDGVAGDDMTWVTGDRIKAVWVGQDMSGLADVAQEFGFTSYETDFDDNVDDAGDILVSNFSIDTGSSDDPIDWDTDPNVWGSSDPADPGPF